ncbi:MAG: hypothetical protein ABIQ39_11645 [Ilumatobacteraceae bacterium]
MRRTLAGLLFGLAYLCASLAIGGWLLQRSAFSPDRSRDAADAVLADGPIRAQVVNLIADATAPQLGAPPAAVSAQINGLLTSPATAQAMSLEMASIIHDAHAHLIGQQKAPVQITADQMRNIVRSDAVSSLPPITLPVPEIGALSFIRQLLTWLVPAAAIAAVLLGIVALTTHPERSVLVRSLGFGLLLLAVLIALIGYVVPKFVVSTFSSNAWARIPALLANDTLPLVIALDVVLVGVGLALLIGSGLLRRRQRWSAPVSTYRYNEERRWG